MNALPPKPAGASPVDGPAGAGATAACATLAVPTGTGGGSRNQMFDGSDGPLPATLKRV